MFIVYRRLLYCTPLNTIFYIDAFDRGLKNTPSHDNIRTHENKCVSTRVVAVIMGLAIRRIKSMRSNRGVIVLLRYRGDTLSEKRVFR